MQGAFNVMQQVLAGGFDVGYVGVETAVMGKQPNNPQFPARFIYNYLRRSIWEIVVPENSQIQKLEDLKGKTIGVAGLAYGNIPVTKAALASSGMKPSDVQLQPVGIGAPAFRALTSGQVDALNLWNSMHAALERTGFKIRRIPLGSRFSDMPSHGLIANNKTIESDADLLTKFGRAWAKSEVACAANIDGCLKAFYKRYPQTKPNMPLEEAVVYDRPVLSALNTRLLYFAPGEPQLWGAFTDNDWRLIVDALSAGEAIEKSDIPYEQLYTNAFVAGYNDFDRAAVEERAKSFK